MYAFLPGPTVNTFARDKPRFLTSEEIKDIIDKFPVVQAANTEAGALIRAGIQNWLRANLATEQVCPSAIPDLINEIIAAHYDSAVIPGTTIGTHAAEAVGASSTQGALKTFHAAGSSKSISAGIDVMKELLDVKKTRKNEIVTLCLYINIGSKCKRIKILAVVTGVEKNLIQGK